MADLMREYKRKNTFLRKWGALLILVVFFILSWGGQFYFQMQATRQESQQHGQEFSMNEFLPQFWSSTLENWQSEWLQLATQAVLIAALADYFFRKGNQDHYKTQLMIDELRNDLKKAPSAKNKR